MFLREGVRDKKERCATISSFSVKVNEAQCDSTGRLSVGSLDEIVFTATYFLFLFFLCFGSCGVWCSFTDDLLYRRSALQTICFTDDKVVITVCIIITSVCCNCFYLPGESSPSAHL